MSGHNKWSKIKHKKTASDAKKSQVFGKLSRLITAESKRANGDVNAPSLRAAIEKAREASMPNDNIERAVAKGTSGGAESMDEVVYELYGPGGVALIVTALTDNKNRTTQELKHLVSKLGYAIAAPGSAAWAFTKTGTEYEPHTTTPLAEADSASLDTLIEALEEHDDVQGVYTNAE